MVKDDICNALNIAKDELKSSKILLDAKQYRSSVSSSYYAIFSASKALLYLKNRDARTHTGLINIMSEEYYKTGKFSRELFKCLTKGERLR